MKIINQAALKTGTMKINNHSNKKMNKYLEKKKKEMMEKKVRSTNLTWKMKMKKRWKKKK